MHVNWLFIPISRGGGGELPFKNDVVPVGNFGNRISFDGHGSNEFFSLRGTNSKTTHIIHCRLFSAQSDAKRYSNNSNDGHFSFQHP